MKISFLDMTLAAQRKQLEPYPSCWGSFFKAEVLDDGRLKIVATDAGRRWIRDEQNDPHRAIVDLDEEILVAGVGLELTMPSEVGALTDAPLCCLERDVDDDCNIVIVGPVWGWMNYQIESLADALRVRGEAVLTKG